MIEDFRADMAFLLVGDSATCAPFGIGSVAEIRSDGDLMIAVTLNGWKLATGSSPLFYGPKTAVQKVSTNKFGILQIFDGIISAVETSDYETHLAIGSAPGLAEKLKVFIESGIIARRPLNAEYYDELCESFLRLVVRLARQTLQKITSNAHFIEAISSPDLGLLPLIVQIMAEHLSRRGVSHWGCWLFAVLARYCIDFTTL
jgi:hypothetical protein